MINFFFYKKLFYTAALFTGCCFVCSCENDVKVIDDMTKKVVMREEAVNVESMQSLHCDFYNESTQIETWLDSKYGKYFETLGKVYLRDSVIVITTKGDTLKSPDLWWDQNKKMFYTDKYATYHSPGKQVSGTIGLEATQDLTSIIFKQPIGTIQVSESGFPQ